MGRQSKRVRETAKLVNRDQSYTLDQAVELLKKCPQAKFNESVEISLKTSVDARKSDQQVRATVSLPNGTGKQITLLVFAKGEKMKEALDAGADFAGHDELIEKVKGGWTGFNAVIATPDMMREVGKLGKILGPRGLMPTPKTGNVTNEVARAVQEVKAGKIEFKVDKNGVINCLVGKLSFTTAHLIENMVTLIAAIVKSRPATAKGAYVKSLHLSSTMGPGLKIDLTTIPVIQGGKE